GDHRRLAGRTHVLCVSRRRGVFASPARRRSGAGARRGRRATRAWARGRRVSLDPGSSGRLVEIRRVGIVGLGTMGAGIAQVSVQSGFETVGREVSDELAERGRATVERYLDRGVEKGRLSQPERDGAVGRLTLTTDLADLASCDLVIEAVLEELDLKRELFAELDRVTRSNAIL